MDTILETSAAVELIRDAESVRQAYDGLTDQPRPEWLRGTCPTCGGPVVANCYYVGGRGYRVLHECWASLSTPPICTYRKVL